MYGPAGAVANSTTVAAVSWPTAGQVRVMSVGLVSSAVRSGGGDGAAQAVRARTTPRAANRIYLRQKRMPLHSTVTVPAPLLVRYAPNLS